MKLKDLKVKYYLCLSTNLTVLNPILKEVIAKEMTDRSHLQAPHR